MPLPWNLPDKETMQEMIDDEICKVCGRPAKKEVMPITLWLINLMSILIIFAKIRGRTPTKRSS